MSRDSYSLMRGGLVHRVLHASGALHRSRRLSVWLAALLTALALLPMMLLAHAEATLWPRHGAMALFGDYATLARLLLGLPLLILAAPRADDLLRTSIRQLTHASLVRPQRQHRLHALLARVRRSRDSWVPELVCIGLAIAPVLYQSGVVSLLQGVPDWRTTNGVLTAAGHWDAWVATPLFRLVVLLWLWRFVLWTLLLWRLPWVGLDLHAEHPDQSAGLAFLGLAQERFSGLAAAGGLLVSGACVNQMLYMGTTLYDLRHLLAGYVVGATVLLMAPLLLLTPLLVRVRRHALYRFGALGNRAAATFEERWQAASDATAGPDSLVDTGDASAIADFGGVYQSIVAMSVVPITRWNLLSVAMAAVVPLMPLALLAFPFDELVAKLMGILV
ncbi:hypothetical protein [uncultured Stenotrophomonas sp.]|uniref:hypothetical protein n=1 Tax=uncultured Stenotrophomonas sp. TaxID=165438 RepID=UPI0028E35AA1|nr:hypothetical protein [uncultured Stenotrophomonas sp.]